LGHSVFPHRLYLCARTFRSATRRDDSGAWHRAYGNENREFDADGLLRRRIASINEHAIEEADRKFRWPPGRRPDDHPGLSDFGF
jgi:nuclear transport factor 2 (NTF2) superfamily protein